jgi:hypothetical protein
MGQLMDRAVGKLKQVTGALRGKRSEQLEGVLQEQKGKIEHVAEQVKCKVDAAYTSSDKAKKSDAACTGGEKAKS